MKEKYQNEDNINVKSDDEYYFESVLENIKTGEQVTVEAPTKSEVISKEKEVISRYDSGDKVPKESGDACRWTVLSRVERKR